MKTYIHTKQKPGKDTSEKVYGRLQRLLGFIVAIV